MTVLMNSSMMGMGQRFYPYKINQSCRFNDNDSAYLHWTPGVVGTRTTHSLSFWIKRCNLTLETGGIFGGGSSLSSCTQYAIKSSEQLQFKHEDLSVQDSNIYFDSLLRDPASWMHVFCVYDSTEVVNIDRLKTWYNGIEVFDAAGANYISLNKNSDISTANPHYIGRSRMDDTGRYGDYYLAEFQFMDGLVQAVTDFGKFKNGIWIPKKYTGSYGTNGFYQKYDDSSDLGKDSSGNGNDWTSSGLDTTDQVLDTPTNNYPTLNPIGSSRDNYTFKDGNLLGVNNTASRTGIATIPFPKTGKWYVEFTKKVTSPVVGIVDIDNRSVVSNGAFYISVYGWGYRDNGYIYTNGAGAAYGDGYVADEVCAIVFDADEGTLHFYNENVDQGEAYSGLTTGQYAVALSRGSGSPQTLVNFGQLGFTYTPPAGYKALCSENIPEPTIIDSSTGFDVVLYEGTGAEQDITDLNFDISDSGGLVCLKNRDTSDEHKWIDSVRGVTYEISSDSTNIQAADANGLTAFLSNGFTLGTGANGYNDNGESFVAWCFRKGAAYGFDIQTYEGTGVAHVENHDLGGAPELMIVKNLDSTTSWQVYHHYARNKTDPETDYGILDTTAAFADSNTRWNDTAPTTTQFTIGTSNAVNANGDNILAYLWKSIEGFSKVFSYTGNGNADGPFVYCGFRPRYILIKNSDSVQAWGIIDAVRNTYNVCDAALTMQGSDAEVTRNVLDITANGFKIRNIFNSYNLNGSNIVGIAIAEAPGKWSNAR